MSDIDIVFTCKVCNKKFGDGDVYIMCDGCHEEEITNEDIQAAIKHSLDSDGCEDREFTKFAEDVTEKEIEHYFNGMRRGRETALFWIANFFGGEMVRFWEKLEKEEIEC